MNIGIYQSYWGGVGGGQRYVAVVAEILAREHEVEIVHHAEDYDADACAEAMDVDLSQVGFRYVPRPERVDWPTRNPIARLRFEREFGAELSRPYDVFIDSSDSPPYFCHAKRGVLLCHFPLISFDEFHGHDEETWGQRSVAVRCLMGGVHRFEWRRRVGSYDRSIVNSRYTQHWMKRRWGLTSEILYPPLRSGFQPQPKQPDILTIGAFRDAQHKQHRPLIETFRRLCDEGLEGWRLVLVGTTGTNPRDADYVDSLRQEARGYPIELCTNVPGTELVERLERASLLWHAMGYGVDGEQHPERLEHFGMVATEAMAAGCVPIVFDGGGLQEIVTHGKDGFRFQTLDELMDCTQQAVGDNALRHRLGQAAFERARDFGGDVFERQLLKLLHPVLT